MHRVYVTLENPDGLRLSLGAAVPVRSTAHENAARDEAEVRANADAGHSKYGPWSAKSSRFEC